MKEELLHLYRFKDGDGIKVAFQWNEHSRQRIVHNFSSTSTVKVIHVMIFINYFTIFVCRTCIDLSLQWMHHHYHLF